MTLFFALGIVGTVILLATLIFDGIIDGIFDNFDLGDGFLSVTSISAFVASFGWAGVISESVGLSQQKTLIISAVVGIVIASIAGLLSRYLSKGEEHFAPSSQSLLGEHGVVISRIKENSFGTVRLKHGGHLITVSARSEEAIVEGAKVQVVSVLSATSVQVVLIP